MNIRKVIIYVVSVALLVIMTMPSHVSVNAASLSDLQKKVSS